ncbi:Coq4 family protein [Hyphomonas sp.]|jgi:ubiquinone biosynthesis protein Coq4|uniref:Coq4 family protein n=1 Tax=Hyphomonas sp. TaxID=87 RepID=UPI0039E2D32F
MNFSGNRELFEREVTEAPDVADVKWLAAEAKASNSTSSHELRTKLAARLAHAAFLAPDRVGEIYDALAEGWIGEPVGAAPIPTLDEPAMTAPDNLWNVFWSITEDGAAGKLDALAVTARTAALGKELDDSFRDRVVKTSFTYEGVSEIATLPLPRRHTLEELGACPDNSVGRLFYNVIVDNSFDLEVLDRDAIGLSQLPSPLDYLNTRMLQAHDLWHLVGGYETTSLHEIAISAFQMSQFGHSYSAQFLAVTAVIGAQGDAMAYPILMDTITSAWVHGRHTPPMITIDWESVWTGTLEEVRAQFGIKAYERPYPANLIEMAMAAAA